MKLTQDSHDSFSSVAVSTERGRTETHQSHLKCSYVHKWPQEHCVPPDVPSFCTSGGDSLHRARHVNKLLLLAVQKHHFSRQSTCTHSPYINMHRYTNEFTKLFPARKGTELYEGDSWCITSGLNSLQTLPNKTHTHTSGLMCTRPAHSLVFWNVDLQSAY